MSIKKPQILFLLLFGISYGAYNLLLPAVAFDKKSFSPSFNISQYSSRGVVDRIIHLKIETTNLQKNSSSTTTEAVAFVSLPFNFEGSVHYKWTLGQNVHLVEGALEGNSIMTFKKEEPQSIKLIVEGFDPSQLRHIGFEIWTDKNNRRLYADGLISSQKENSFEDVVQYVEKLKAEKMGVQK